MHTCHTITVHVISYEYRLSEQNRERHGEKEEQEGDCVQQEALADRSQSSFSVGRMTIISQSLIGSDVEYKYYHLTGEFAYT